MRLATHFIFPYFLLSQYLVLEWIGLQQAVNKFAVQILYLYLAQCQVKKTPQHVYIVEEKRLKPQ